MPEVQITCPSGLVGEIRGLKTKEVNLLSDRQALRNGTALDLLLKSCWLRTIESGPYGTGDPDWSKVLLGDRTYTLLRIRAATFGEEYAFAVRCEECRERFEWEIKLCDLPVKPLPEESRIALQLGKHLDATFDGKKIRLKLLTGADEARNTRLFRQNQKSLPLIALSSRILEIEGVQPSDKVKYLEELDYVPMQELIRLMDSFDCGVETSIEVECVHCSCVQEIQLPFGSGFLTPKKKR